MIQNTFVLSGELPVTAFEYCIAGDAKNGDVRTLEDGIIAVGQDAILHLPEYGLFGVFDGAGGAEDVGRPEVASQTAAKAVKTYVLDNAKPQYMEAGLDALDHEATLEFMKGVMGFARSEVLANQSAGLTTALFEVVRRQEQGFSVYSANAGDSSLLLYPDPSFDDYIGDDICWLTGDQEDVAGNPSNILGRVPDNIHLTDADQFTRRSFAFGRERLLMLSTDGITGSYHFDDGIDIADIEFATQLQPLLESLRSDAAFLTAVANIEKRASTTIDLDNLTWFDWEKIKPVVDKFVYTQTVHIRRQGLTAIASRLLTPKLVRDEAFPPRRTHDDKSLVLIRVPVDHR
jgi:serine/threonine protein phosphatase PrpC